MEIKNNNIKRLEKRLAALKKERLKLRKNLEYNGRKKAGAKSVKDYSKYSLAEEFYQKELGTTDLEIQSVEGKIAEKVLVLICLIYEKVQLSQR